MFAADPCRLPILEFQPSAYCHWQLELEPPIAWLRLNVSETGGVFEGYELKMNSYDIGVDIELNHIIQSLRFEHPEIKAVVVGSARRDTWCAGANIRMLAGSSHQHKVNFCKFTNETRNAMEDASRFSGQTYLSAIDGPAAGGGYELALATDYLLLIDDGNAAVSLPEVPLLAVLPGTGGLTRLVDKRRVRRDLADVFSTLEEGVRGQRAVAWRLVDETLPRSQFQARVEEVAAQRARASDRPEQGGIALTPLRREISDSLLSYSHLTVSFDRKWGHARFDILAANAGACPADEQQLIEQGASFWPLALMRELDDAILHCRFNEPNLGTWLFTSQGSVEAVLAFDGFLHKHQQHWLVREVLLLIKRTLKRLDVSSRSLFTLIEPGSCFAGFLAELAFAADRSYMLKGSIEGDARPPATLTLTQSNFGNFPMPNDQSRLESRFYGEPENLSAANNLLNQPLPAEAACSAGLVTFTPDDIDWEEEIRLLLEERSAYSPDALTGMEASLRFPGPETMESKIFARLTAWQNWIFQRNNAVGEAGALRRYGTGKRPVFDKNRV